MNKSGLQNCILSRYTYIHISRHRLAWHQGTFKMYFGIYKIKCLPLASLNHFQVNKYNCSKICFLSFQISLSFLVLHMCPSFLITMHSCNLWQYRLWCFQRRDTKLERFQDKNQHTQGKSLNFENWSSGELSKIGHHFRK